MSDSVTNIEIEDVLSSIRRLVSEETRKKTGAGAEPAGPAAAPDSPVRGRGGAAAAQEDVSPDKLVLTPALRVPHAPEDDAPEEHAPEDHAQEASLDAGDVDNTAVENADAPTDDAALAFVPSSPDMPETPDRIDEEPFADEDAADRDNAAAGDAATEDPDSDIAAEAVPGPYCAEPSTEPESDPDAEAEETSEPDAPPISAETAWDITDVSDEEAPQTADAAGRGRDGPPWSDPNATLYSAAEAAQEEPDDDPASDADPADGADGQVDVLVFTDHPTTIPAEETGDHAPEDTDPPETDGAAQDMTLQAGEGPTADNRSDSEPDANPVPGPDAAAAPYRSEPPGLDGLASKIAALETRLGRREEVYDPDEPGTSAYAGVPVGSVEWDEPVAYSGVADADPNDQAEPDTDTIDTAETGADAFPDHGEVPSRDERTIEGAVEADDARREAEEANADIFATDEMVLDEATLRELVTDIVREELQGALGERITRNVRKLVRREIHRALAAQELG
ncbi:MAG: hypothetical protein ACWA5A_18820 [Marinibacterium sp.]